MAQESLLKFFRSSQGYAQVAQADFSSERESLEKQIRALQFSSNEELLSRSGELYTGGVKGALEGWQNRILNLCSEVDSDAKLVLVEGYIDVTQKVVTALDTYVEGQSKSEENWKKVIDSLGQFEAQVMKLSDEEALLKMAAYAFLMAVTVAVMLATVFALMGPLVAVLGVSAGALACGLMFGSGAVTAVGYSSLVYAGLSHTMGEDARTSPSERDCFHNLLHKAGINTLFGPGSTPRHAAREFIEEAKAVEQNPSMRFGG